MSSADVVVREMKELTEAQVLAEIASGVCTPEDGEAMIEALRAARVAKHRARFAQATSRLLSKVNG